MQFSYLYFWIACFQSEKATFIDDLKHLLLPFLLRCEQEAAGSRKQLLLDYLKVLSSKDLSLPHKLFEHLHDEHSCSLVPSVEEKISLALECLYAYPNADQLRKAFHILECIPRRGFGWAFRDLCLFITVLRVRLYNFDIVTNSVKVRKIDY